METKLRCEYHENCDEPVIVSIGLRDRGVTVSACQRAFHEWQEKELTAARSSGRSPDEQ